MPAPRAFHLVSRWTVPAPAALVADILTDPLRFPDWWGAVYLSIRETDPGDAQGIGRTVEVHSRGWLPYHLRWSARLVSTDLPHSWTIAASGDLVGTGIWTLTETGGGTRVTYDWTVLADRPLFRWLAPLFWPLMASNHRWAMARGEAGLRCECARRLGKTGKAA